MDTKTGILVTIIIILAIALGYLLLFPGMMGEQAALENQEQQEEQMEEKQPNFMESQIPVGLTAEQMAQLKIGAEAHTPKSLTFNVTGGSFYFTPNEIRVKQGDKVKIILTNAGGTHNLILGDFGVETKTIQTGQTDTIEFTANKKGTFVFYCGVGNGYHRQQGQLGVLIVE